MAFMPIVFLLYWFVFRGRRWQNLLVVIASYVFYGWWDWRFLSLIALTTVFSFVSGLLIERFNGQEGRRRLVSAANIIINLAILGYFKYFNFFVDNIQNAVQALFGYELDWVTTSVILPVGISFYTFQALSYSIDVYRGKINATHDIVEFAAYISFFPQLVAGPIERATNLLPQFQHGRRFDYAQAVDGLRQMLWGFFKKIVVADNCATAVNLYWSDYQNEPGIMLLSLAVLFSIQIYCDFSGYSDIAIGCARLFGFRLMRNFDYPYFSRSIPEFWRRWHISLTSWFRDYVYIPLGGNRCPAPRVMCNVFIVWAISGLWHGANWTFICWGLFHAVLLIIYNTLGFTGKRQAPIAQGRWLPTIKEVLQMCLTFALAMIGWIIFRADNMPQAIDFISRMLLTMTDDLSLGAICGKRGLLMALAVLIIEWVQRDKQNGLQLSGHGLLKYPVARYALYASIIVIMFFWSGQVQTFIYFQF